MPKKGKKLNEAQVQQQMNAYSAANVGPILEDAFGAWDHNYNPADPVPYLDQADHIVIGDRTVSEILMTKFDQEIPAKDGYQRNTKYSSFYQSKGKQFIKQIVSEALSKGETVEVFVPDERGRIKDTPMHLTASGSFVAAKELKPVQMNRWQKFWSKLGFYKEKKAAAVSYEKKLAVRNRVKFCNKAARTALACNSSLLPAYQKELEKHHPDMIADMNANFPQAGGDPAALGECNGFKTNRSSYMSTVICVLATKRDQNGQLMYTNEQIFDLNDPKMQKARADAMKEVYDHYKSGALLEQEQRKQTQAKEKGEKYGIDPKLTQQAAKDRDWLVDIQHDASNVLVDRINQQARKLDFSKPNLTEQKGYREFALFSDTAFDQSQDMFANHEQMDKRYGKGAYYEASGKVGMCSQAYRTFTKSMLAQKYSLNGVPGNDESCLMNNYGKVFGAQLLQQQVGKQLTENPKLKFSDVVEENFMNKVSNADQQAQYDDDIELAQEQGTQPPDLYLQSKKLAQEHNQNPEQFRNQIASGVLEQRMQVTEVGSFGKDALDRETGAKFKIQSAKTAEQQLQQMKQPQKTSGGLHA